MDGGTGSPPNFESLLLSTTEREQKRDVLSIVLERQQSRTVPICLRSVGVSRFLVQGLSFTPHSKRNSKWGIEGISSNREARRFVYKATVLVVHLTRQTLSPSSLTKGRQQHKQSSSTEGFPSLAQVFSLFREPQIFVDVVRAPTGPIGMDRSQQEAVKMLSPPQNMRQPIARKTWVMLSEKKTSERSLRGPGHL